MKPLLFHDIDGVLYGTYGGVYQLRPGVKPWLEWASEHFEIVWLTTWDVEKIKTLLSVIGCEKYRKALVRPETLRRADWERTGDKAVWLAAQADLKRVEWAWIDDIIPGEQKLLQLCLDSACCVAVDPEGENALEALRGRLEGLLILRTGLPQN
jgi:hypothetical protein